jgi:hypothetical protein
MRIKLCGLIACAAMLAAGVVSCQQHDDIPQGVKYPILFDSPDTRAVADLDDLKEGFKVYAFVEGNAGSTSFTKDVVYNADNSVWAFESPEYWIPYTTYSFKAFYPATLTAGTLEVDNSSNALNFTISNFDVVNHQVDVMVASATAKVESGPVPTSGDVNGNRVNLNFQHLLACVEIQMKSAISGVTIDEIHIEGANNEETYTSSSGTWTNGKPGTIQFDSGVELEAGADEYKVVTSDGILVIPASSSGKTLVIATTIGSNEKEYRVEFPEINWAKGTKYTYTAEIKQNNIVFQNLEVDEWDSENATGSVIIK